MDRESFNIADFDMQVDSLDPAKLGTAGLVHEVSMPGSSQKVVKVTGVPRKGASVTILVRGSNKLVLEEADRSLHDALCVVRSLVKKRYLISGGGSAEVEACLELGDRSKTKSGAVGFCLRAFADALEVVPYTLAENAGLNPIHIVTQLRKRHRAGERDAGINVKQGCIDNMYTLNVVQPLLVNISALHLATECICMILKIDDLVLVR
ncbi:MAG: TCP-1/cpn60 chaperonin family protein [Synechococcus sp.]